LEKIIDTAKHPLFIIPERFEGDATKKILFVANPDKEPSVQLRNQLIEICKKTQSNLEILFVLKTQNQHISENVKSNFNNYFEGIDITLNTISNKTKCKGINNYLNQTNRDLIVIEND
jgi:hypothetical protein